MRSRLSMLRNAKNVHALRTAALITLVTLAALQLGPSGQAGPVTPHPSVSKPFMCLRDSKWRKLRARIFCLSDAGNF